MKRFKNILYICEQSVVQEAAINRAVSLAQNNQAKLTVMDVVPEISAGIGMPPGGPISIDLTEAMIAERRKMLESLIDPYRKHLNISVDVTAGRKFLEVIHAVSRNNHDLVIKPAENPGWIDRLFGSDDMHLLRKCPCPLWVMKPEEKPNYKCIVAAIDFDPHDTDLDEQALNREILELASSLALSDFADLHLVHVWDAPEAGFISLWANNPDKTRMNIIEGQRARHESEMNNLVQNLREQVGTEAYKYLSPRVHLPMGEARKIIPAVVKELKADLVVIGTVARSGIPGLIIGNTAEAVLDQLTCSVLAVKPPGFISPVLQA